MIPNQFAFCLHNHYLLLSVKTSLDAKYLKFHFSSIALMMENIQKAFA